MNLPLCKHATNASGQLNLTIYLICKFGNMNEITNRNANNVSNADFAAITRRSVEVDNIRNGLVFASS